MPRVSRPPLSFTMATFRFAGILVLIGMSLVWMPSCKNSDHGESSDSSARPVALSEVERGPVRLKVEVDPAEPRLSDEPKLTIEINAHMDVEVEEPPFGDALAGFQIRNYRKQLAEIQGDRKIYRQVYTLEPDSAGEHVIYPIPVRFKDNRPDGDGETHTIESEAVVVNVKSLADGQIPSLSELRGPSKPIPLPTPPLSPYWYGLIAVPLLGVAAFLLWRRRVKVAEPEKVLSPQELAYLEMEKIIHADWISREEYQTYYVELTGVVRRYIERTTDIRAPEQTTAEFLEATRRSSSIPETEKQQLRAFLEAADLVKFAGMTPSATQIESSFERAKEFVGLSTNKKVSAERVPSHV